MQVILYAREGCHLCEVAREVLLGVRERIPFSFDDIDIDPDDALVREYGFRVPVVLIDGEVRFEIEVDRAELERMLQAG